MAKAAQVAAVEAAAKGTKAMMIQKVPVAMAAMAAKVIKVAVAAVAAAVHPSGFGEAEPPQWCIRARSTITSAQAEAVAESTKIAQTEMWETLAKNTRRKMLCFFDGSALCGFANVNGQKEHSG